MRRNIERWRKDGGFNFTPDWLLRNVNAVATGKAPFSELTDVSAAEFQDALHETLHHVDHFLSELAVGRLGLDHDRVLFGRYAIPVISRLLHNRGGRFADGAEADRALYWYVHAALRGRFAGSTETFLAKDLVAVDKDGIDGVIAALARTRKGNLSIDAQDFEGLGRGSRAYPLLYLLGRVTSACDLITGHPLGQDTSAVQVHEIFPKEALAGTGRSRADGNAIANFAFVTPSSGTALSGREPAEYLASLGAEARRSQWIPDDPALWRIGRHDEFFAARRELLAEAANDFLDSLLGGTHPWGRLEPIEVVVKEDPDPRTVQIQSLVTELTTLGFVRPALDTEIPDPETGRVLAVAEAFWPDGFQPGLGKPVVLELDPEEADVPRLAELGYDVFTAVDALLGYVRRLTEQTSGDRDAGSGATGLAELDRAPDDVESGGAFERALFGLIERCRNELSYNPNYLRDMAHQYGALGAVQRLLASPTVSDGFVRLWDAGRVDLTVETLAADDRFAHLFTDKELDTAHRRLAVVRRDPVGAGRA